MLSLTRSIALRVPLLAFRAATPVILQRSPFVSSLSTYRALSAPFSVFAAVGAATKSAASKTAGRSKAPSKTKASAKPKSKAKAKPKAKAKAAPKRKLAAKSKPKVSTRVPLIQRPPKRPPPPFLLYYTSVYPTPGSNAGGVTSASKQAGEAWHKLSDSEKQVYRDKVKDLLVNYRTERDDWYKKPENLQVLKTLNKDRKKRGKKRIHAPPNVVPKRPLTSFLRFSQELRETNMLSSHNAPVGTQSPQTWVARECGVKWKALPAFEKEKYSKAYHADLMNWKAQNATATA